MFALSEAAENKDDFKSIPLDMVMEETYGI